MKPIVSTLRSFAASRRANVAIEFALITPVLIVLLIGAVDYGRMTFERSDMFAATRSGTQYFMAGGADNTRAATIISATWTGKPADASVVVRRDCECAALPYQCSAPCPDGTVPAAYAVVELSATLDGIYKDFHIQASDRVRVR